MKFKYKDKVIVTDPKYAIAEVGTVGEIVNDGNRCEGGGETYLVRWESTPTMLWGVHDCSIESPTTLLTLLHLKMNAGK